MSLIKVNKTDRAFEVSFDYNAHLVNEVKKIRGRSWDGSKKAWLIPHSSESQLQEFIEKFDVQESGDFLKFCYLSTFEGTPVSEPDLPESWNYGKKEYAAILFWKNGSIDREFLGDRTDYNSKRTSATIEYSNRELQHIETPGTIIESRDRSRKYYRRDEDGWKLLGYDSDLEISKIKDYVSCDRNDFFVNAPATKTAESPEPERVTEPVTPAPAPIPPPAQSAEPEPAPPPAPTRQEIEERMLQEVVDILPVSTAKNSKMSIWINDNYYTENPDHVTGEAYETSGRFGNVIKYRGTLAEAMQKIPAPNYEVAETISPFVSWEAEEMPRPGRIRPIQSRRIKMALEAEQETPAFDPDNIFSFDEIDEQYNAHLTLAEKQAFVWYMRRLGRPMLGGWRKYYINEDETTATLYRWVKEGVMAVENDNYVPSFIYLSGNVYHKKADLERNKDSFIQQFGEPAYEAQWHTINEKVKEMYEKRLTLDAPNKEDRLRILPTSDFAMEMTIGGLKGDEKFKEVKSKRKDSYGKPDYAKTGVSDYKKEVIDEISLSGAFVLWMKNNSSRIAFRKQISWLDILDLYLNDKQYSEKTDGPDKDKFKKKKSAAKEEGIRLFGEFLANEIDLNDKVKIETVWNMKYNAEVQVDYNKVPIGFRMARTYSGVEMDIRPEKREAIAFAMMTGSGCLAYGVGLGKTWCASFIIAQFLENGWCQRPMLVMPNQVYKQFMKELKGIVPWVTINDFYNLSPEYLEKIPEGKKVSPNSVTLFTYEGFRRLGIKGEGEQELFDTLYEILEQKHDKDNDKFSQKAIEAFNNKIDGIIGRSQTGAHVYIQDLGIDFFCIDEAHSAKKIFTVVAGSKKEVLSGKEKQSKPYKITAGTPSYMGLKAFMVATYVQRKNNTGNVLLLTATPFTNSPLEVYSMLALTGYKHLERLGLNNLISFFDEFIDVRNELVIDVALKPVFKEIFVGFTNLPGLQGLIRRFFLYKFTTKQTKRPNKWVLPMRSKTVDGVAVQLTGEEVVDTIIPLTSVQRIYMDQIQAYAEGKIELVEKTEDGFVCINSRFADGADEEDDDEDDTTDISKIVLRGLRQLSGMCDGAYSLDGCGFSKLDTDTGKSLAAEKSLNKKQTLQGARMLKKYHGQLDEATNTAVAELLKNPDDFFQAKDDESEFSGDTGEVSESSLDADEKAGVRLLRAANYARNLALSPYLYACNDLGAPDYLQYVETSAKIAYVMKCIATVKEWHDRKGEPVSGQVIYMNTGVKYFPLLKEYLVKEIGFKNHEVGIIQGSMPKGMDKSAVQDLFLGRRFNTVSREYEPIPDQFRIKVLIGSASIKEGINLQTHSTVLYNCWLDWNPTDVVQLEGRIWRQGNRFKNVRIVNPLSEDSMDIFMFQKLEEKTRRINAIWEYDGNTKTLNLEEFDPRELKYALIKDPKRVAELEVKEGEEQIENDMAYLETQRTTLEDFMTIRNRVFENYRLDKFIKIATFFRNVTAEEMKADPNRLQRTLLDIWKKQTLKDGTPIKTLEKETTRPTSSYGGYGRHSYSSYWKNPYEDYEIRNGEAHTPYGFSEWNDALRKYNRIVSDVLRPRNIDPSEEAIKEAKEKLKGEIEEMKKAKEALSSEDAIAKRAAAIQEERERTGYQPASIDQRVMEFARTNHLLADKAVLVTVGDGANLKPLFREGQKVKYDGKNASVLEIFADRGGEPMYKLQAGSNTELVFESEIEGGRRKEVETPPVVAVVKKLETLQQKIRALRAKLAA